MVNRRQVCQSILVRIVWLFPSIGDPGVGVGVMRALIIGVCHRAPNLCKLPYTKKPNNVGSIVWIFIIQSTCAAKTLEPPPGVLGSRGGAPFDFPRGWQPGTVLNGQRYSKTSCLVFVYLDPNDGCE